MPLMGDIPFADDCFVKNRDSCHGIPFPLSSPGFSEGVVLFLLFGLLLIGFITLWTALRTCRKAS